MPGHRTGGRRGAAAKVAFSTILFVLLACSSATYDKHEFHNGALRYRTGQLSSDWRRISVEDANLVFKHKNGGAILVNAMCGSREVDDVPLDVLVNHLLFGVEVEREIARNPFTLDGRGALRTHIRGTLDGVPIELDLVVVKKDGCTFDFQLVAGHDEFNERRPEFEAFFQAFQKLAGGAS